MARERPRWWLALGLMVLAFIFTTTLGAEMTYVVRSDRVIAARYFATPLSFLRLARDPELLRTGLAFSCSALGILLAHELGHYFACRYYRLRCTLPYFLPAPLGFGMMGAFIRIKQPMRNRRELFDVGIAGPLAGFVVLVPILLYGIAQSSVGSAPLPAPADTAVALPQLGENLLIHLVRRWFHGELPADAVLDLHPAAVGAWLGCLATALNLLPIGQLDGGHILYALAGRHQRRIALALWLALASLGFWQPSWFVWCLLILVLTRLRHPRLADEESPPGRARLWLGILALVLLALTFIPVPIRDLVTIYPEHLEPAGERGDLIAAHIVPSR